MRFVLFVLIIVDLFLLFGCKENSNQKDDAIITNNKIINNQSVEVEQMTLKITSDAFKNNSNIPAKYTCKGEDVSPSLIFEGVPANTKSLALIVDDPDAPMGDWVHWVMFNINPKSTKINEDSLPNGAILGRNDFGKLDWGGPCPPSGTHRYFFKLYALDTVLSLNPGVTKQQLLSAMNGHIIEKTELMGLFKK